MDKGKLLRAKNEVKEVSKEVKKNRELWWIRTQTEVKEVNKNRE